MARAIKLINAPVGLFDIDGVLVLKTEYSTQHEDGAITPDCYIVDSGEYFWGGVDSVEERNNLMVTPIDMPTLTPPNEWVSVEERLPEDEARQYIEDNLDGIGYLYPCLLTYKSPNTERIHVVRFYYDIIQKWFVNNGEELCEKGRCIAWMPLPAPYDRRPPEGEEETP